jgi:hypothetical protein
VRAAGLKRPVCRAPRREDRLGDGPRRAPERGPIAGAGPITVMLTNCLENRDQNGAGAAGEPPTLSGPKEPCGNNLGKARHRAGTVSSVRSLLDARAPASRERDRSHPHRGSLGRMRACGSSSNRVIGWKSFAIGSRPTGMLVRSYRPQSFEGSGNWTSSSASTSTEHTKSEAIAARRRVRRACPGVSEGTGRRRGGQALEGSGRQEFCRGLWDNRPELGPSGAAAPGSSTDRPATPRLAP